MKLATQKDIEYALQFGGERLLKTINYEKSNIEWSFAKSGAPVDRGAAEKFLYDAHCLPLEDGLFPGTSQSFGWRD